jgi:alpha-1,3-rhamnosyl/mannosyltransferase
MRIGIDGRELLPGRVTGIGRFLRNFLEGLSLLKPPHEFLVYGDGRTDPAAVPPPAELRTIPGRTTLWWDQARLPRAAARDGVDLLFSPYDKGPLRAACPVVLTAHDLLFLTLSEYRGIRRALYDRSYLLLRQRMFDRASALLTVSGVSRDDLVRLFGIPRERIRVVPNAVAGTYRRVEDKVRVERVKAAYGVTGDYLMHVGNFKPHKNTKALLDAYGRLPEGLRGRYRMVLVGYLDAAGEEVRRAAAARGLSERVVFPGGVADGDLPALYSGASVFAFPSLYEGFGIPPLEAMACGTPVVCADSPPLPEAVGDAALTVDARRPQSLADAIARILEDESLRAHYRARGFARVALFSVERVTRMILDVLEEAASGSPHGPGRVSG